jgi:hypothetical protein
MTLEELDAARYVALLRLAKAARAYQVTMDAGHADRNREMSDWLGGLEREYVELYQRRQILLEDRFHGDEDAA